MRFFTYSGGNVKSDKADLNERYGFILSVSF